MKLKIKKISSLEKARNFEENYVSESDKIELLGGEHYAYQLLVSTDGISANVEVSFESDISDYVKLYRVSDVPMDLVTDENNFDDDFITTKPGLMPDLLIPLEKQNNMLCCGSKFVTIWVDVNIPESTPACKHKITLKFNAHNLYGVQKNAAASDTTEIEIIPLTLPEQDISFTQWFYVDCIATAHNVDIYSEKHWELIDKYMVLATSLGINTILTPVLTPALDTEVSHFRPNVQLVKISESNGKYTFDYTLLDRFIELGKKNGVKTYEISPLYSQWGLKYTPCVYVNDELKFDWRTEGSNPEYTEFLKQFLPSLVAHLATIGIDKKNCLFHISDEPGINGIENYKNAYETIRPLIGDIKILDAISNIDFYNMGLMDIPVCASDHIEPFLDAKLGDLWTYYCCVQTKGVSNRFISMPSYRNRAIGLQLYKFDIKGFLHWGYNFYFSRRSLFPINPHITTSADLGFPSGDSFSVYPYFDDVLPSLRALVFKDALQDVRLMKMVEKVVGKDKIISIMEKYGDCTVTFKSYPKSNMFYKKYTNELKAILKNNM